jgi:PhnB protein
MHLHPHLNFNGQCEAAFRIYAKVLGGEIVMMMTYGESPVAAHVPPDFQSKIVHASLHFSGQELTGADAPPDRYKKPQGFSVLLNVDATSEADRIFTELAANGTVGMPLQQTFWAKRFGMLVDQFDIPWMINCGARD